MQISDFEACRVYSVSSRLQGLGSDRNHFKLGEMYLNKVGGKHALVLTSTRTLQLQSCGSSFKVKDTIKDYVISISN